MKLIFPLIVIVISGLSLRRNYALDAGHHKKAKIVHAILITLFFYLYTGSVSQIIKLFGNFDVVLNSTSGIGLMSKELSIAHLVISTVVNLVALWYFAKMLGRNNKAREIIVKLLPVLGMLASISFYQDFLASGDAAVSDSLVMAIGIAIILSFYVGAMMIYRAQFMRKFFIMEPEEGAKKVDDLIDEIGEGNAT